MTAPATILMGKLQRVVKSSLISELHQEIFFVFCRVIAVMSPEDSWVCKWQRISRFTKGIYAISVSGRLPKGIIRDMKHRGIPYRVRDTSQR